MVDFRRGSDCSCSDLLLGIDIESAAEAARRRGAPAAVSGDNRDGPPWPRRAAPLVRVRQHELTKERRKEQSFEEFARRILFQ